MAASDQIRVSSAGVSAVALARTFTVVIALVGALLPATAAHAHEVDRDIRFVIEQAPEIEGRPIDGLTIDVVRGLAPQLVVENRTGRVLEVLDDRGRAFLRIGPDGVEADQASHGYLDTADPAGLPPGVEVPRDLPPAWVTVRDEPSWGWFDHRLHEQPLRPTEAADAPVVLDRWTLPFRLGGQEVVVRGRTEHAPRTGDVIAALTSTGDPLPGVRVQLLQGPLPGLFLTAEREVTVLGADGEPFLRVGPDGVLANGRSATWLLSGRADTEGAGRDLDRSLADAPGDDPVWVPVATGGAYGWLDPRAAAPVELPDLADDEVGPVTLTAWRVPLVDADGTEVVVAGETRFVPRPPEGGGGPPAWALSVAVALLGAVVLAVATVVRRRRAGARRDDHVVTAATGRAGTTTWSQGPPPPG